MASEQPTHVVELIEAYLAGGLTPDERAAFDAHVQSCAACDGELAKARQADADLRQLFRAARPTSGFEDRIIQTFRTTRPSRRIFLHPAVRRTAIGAAAVLMLGAAGVVVQSSIDGNPISFFNGVARTKVASNLKQIGQAMEMYGRDSDGDGIADAGLVRLQPASQPPGISSYAGVRIQDNSEKPAEKQVRELEERSKSVLADGLPQVQLDMGRHAVDRESISNTREDRRPNDWSFRPQDELKWQEGKDAGKKEMDNRLGEPSLATTPPPAAEPRGEATPADDKSKFYAIWKTQDLTAAVAQAPSSAPDPFAAGLQQNASARKVIRNGSMKFEVDRFDDALMRITKLVVEQGGFVATTDSDKLPNGKMKGTITLRVPPEHMDTLVLTLRGIGDLKSQKIGAEDVTKHYTDLESELRAARAMEERLLDIIKTGKGQIKDLLEAEKQLGVWREKIEQIEGEKRYLDNQIALSTLVLELYERDIQTPSFASETELVNMSLETEKVDDAYEKARSAIESAKGRIVAAEMKQYDAGQFGATVQAAVPPDAAEQVIARLRQLDGRIAHFARESKRTTQNGAAPQTGITTVHREDVLVSIQIYNLANVAPRRSTSVTLATPGVDKTYQQVLDQIRSAGGRVVTSSLTRPDATQQVAELEFQAPADKSDTLEDTLRGLGEIMRHDVTENPDTNNVTEAKRGFHLRIVSIASVPARETQDLQLVASDVPAAYNDILNAVNAAGGRVLQSDLKEQDPHDKNAVVAFEIPRSSANAVNGAIGKAAQLLSRTINHSADAENTLDSKLRMTLAVGSAEKLSPRETVTLREEVSDVERSADDLVNSAVSAGGRRIGDGDVSQDRSGHVTARVIVDVPLDKAPAILDQLDRAGHRRSKQVSFDNSVPEGPLTRARIDVTFSNSAASLGGEESTWDAIRHGLETSALGLRWSLQMLVIGLCFVAPWAILIWGIWKLARRKPRTSPATPPA
jgi:anti-sigma factor RsiW